MSRRPWRVNFAYVIVLVLIAALLVTGTLISDRFATWRNLFTLAQQMGVLGIASLGQTVVILTGGIDLAVGQLIGTTTVFVASFLEEQPDMVWTAVAIALLGSTLVGLLNGVLFVRLRVHPLIVTLGMASLLLGCTLLYRKQPGGSVPDDVENLAYGAVAGLPVPAVAMVAVFALCGAWLRYTKSGRAVYFVGGHPEAARLNGIPVGIVYCYVYAFAGLCAGLAAIILTARTGVGDPRIGNPLTLQSITPVVVGGTVLSGGRGGVTGTLLGVFLVSLLGNVLNYMNVSAFYQWVVQGLIILLAVGLYSRKAGRLA
jgi:ribose/xylose/arabinose/galactoside ABC-type transport system permease subunit